MASYTGMTNLQNHPHRSGFDIGRKNAFTAKVGELLPVYWDISMPGDKYKFNVEYLPVLSLLKLLLILGCVNTLILCCSVASSLEVCTFRVDSDAGH